MIRDWAVCWFHVQHTWPKWNHVQWFKNRKRQVQTPAFAPLKMSVKVKKKDYPQNDTFDIHAQAYINSQNLMYSLTYSHVHFASNWEESGTDDTAHTMEIFIWFTWKITHVHFLMRMKSRCDTGTRALSLRRFCCRFPLEARETNQISIDSLNHWRSNVHFIWTVNYLSALNLVKLQLLFE